MPVVQKLSTLICHGLQYDVYKNGTAGDVEQMLLDTHIPRIPRIPRKGYG